MDAICLEENRSDHFNSRLPGAAGLIGGLGTDAFPRLLFAFANALTRAHHVTAFVSSRAQPPRVLVAENSGSCPVSSGIAALYSTSYWQQDLVNEVTWGCPGRDRWMIHTSASEITQSDYRHACYTAVSLSGRVCVTFGPPDDCLRLNFYSRAGSQFSGEDLGHIAEWSDILMTMLRRHASLLPPEPKAPAAGYSEALRRLPVALAEREIAVCDGIMRGVGSEGIALELGISINTVRTYRKRAYTRLGITSQNELMRLVFSPTLVRLQ